jgi:hypothetical protein
LYNRILNLSGMPRNPMVGTLAACCARAITDHAAALPSPAMNSRRRISGLQRFEGKPIAIRDAMEPMLMALWRPDVARRTRKSFG